MKEKEEQREKKKNMIMMMNEVDWGKWKDECIIVVSKGKEVLGKDDYVS